ncbi:MAG: hypothetical protein IJP43_09010 [Oscillospiraceae bacterium]|nr:hypothetical protein [Oscillospiraceae bacterium]
MDKLELLKKVKALAERGERGEAVAAEATLARLMEKYGISEEELGEETRRRYDFTFHGSEQKRLLRQIVYKVTNGGHAYELRYNYSGRKCKTQLGADCTAAEKVEIEYLFDFYTALYEREREAFLAAFIQKHELYPDTPPEGVEPQRISDEEYYKMLNLMRGMSDESPRRAIEEYKEEVSA